MKKHPLILLLAFAFSGAMAQNNMFWYNPYSFYPAGDFGGGVYEIILQDTSGKVWSCAVDQTNSVLHFLNQDGTKDDSLALSSISYVNGVFDKRNWLWINRYYL